MGKSVDPHSYGGRTPVSGERNDGDSYEARSFYRLSPHLLLALVMAVAYVTLPPLVSMVRSIFSRPLPTPGTYVELQEGSAFPIAMPLEEAERMLASKGLIPPAGGEALSLQPDGTVRITRMSASKRVSLGMCIDLDGATWSEIRALPGIGDKTAQRIVEAMSSKSPLKRPSTLERIKGIGPAKARRLAQYFCRSQQTYLPPPTRGR